MENRIHASPASACANANRASVSMFQSSTAAANTAGHVVNPSRRSRSASATRIRRADRASSGCSWVFRGSETVSMVAMIALSVREGAGSWAPNHRTPASVTFERLADAMPRPRVVRSYEAEARKSKEAHWSKNRSATSP